MGARYGVQVRSARNSLRGALIGLLCAGAPAGAVVADPLVVSLRDDGGNAALDATGPAVSADGRYVAFVSTEALTGTSTGGVRQLYVRDRVAGRTILASASATGQVANADVDASGTEARYAISGDGRFVVYASTATNLSTLDTDGGQRDVFRKELSTGAVAVVSRAATGEAANAGVTGDPDISYDGSRVAYETGAATNLWEDSSGSTSDIVVRDLIFGTTQPASLNSGGTALTGVLQRASISADGGHVAFEDDGTVTVRDLAARITRTPATGTLPDLSGSGRIVTYQAGTGVGAIDVVGGGAETVATTGTRPSISADGRRVAFTTPTALNEPGGPAGQVDAYVRDRPGGTPLRASERVGGGGAGVASGPTVISANGGTVGIELDDGGGTPRLADSDTDGQADIFLSPFSPTDTTPPQITVTSPAAGVVLPNRFAIIGGTVTDGAGVASLTVGGTRATIGAGGAFAVTVTVPSGTSDVPVAAIDGAGNVRVVTVSVSAVAGLGGTLGAKARAQKLRVSRSGRNTLVRFRLDPGASRVAVRLWRRSRSSPPEWVPATVAKVVPRSSGRRLVTVRRKPLAAGVYQVRITVVSAGGVAVSTVRYVAPKLRRGR